LRGGKKKTNTKGKGPNWKERGGGGIPRIPFEKKVPIPKKRPHGLLAGEGKNATINERISIKRERKGEANQLQLAARRKETRRGGSGEEGIKKGTKKEKEPSALWGGEGRQFTKLDTFPYSQKKKKEDTPFSREKKKKGN